MKSIDSYKPDIHFTYVLIKHELLPCSTTSHLAPKFTMMTRHIIHREVHLRILLHRYHHNEVNPSGTKLCVIMWNCGPKWFVESTRIILQQIRGYYGLP